MRSPDPGWIWNEAEDEPATGRANELDVQYALFFALGGVWVLAWFPLGFALTALGALLNALGAGVNDVLVTIFVFGAAFCITGAVDALWRLTLLWIARDRFRVNKDDRAAPWLLGAAMANDLTLLIQIVSGLFFAFRVA